MTFLHTARAVALSTLLAGAVGVAFAQGASAPAASSPAKKALIDKVLLLQQPAIEGLANNMVGAPAQQLMQVAGQALNQLPADKRELLGNEIQAEVRKFYDDVSPGMRAAAVKLAPQSYGTSMETNFSEEELKTIVAWLESPVSKKMLRIGAEGQQALQQKLVAETRGTVEPKIKALEASVSKKLQAAMAAAGGTAGGSAGGNGAAPAAKPAASGPKK